ncbi:MAG: ABC transporter substrate-binding protein [Bifidobacteriaceae bacterium]|jgi:ABC-type nitrate/sulfonate/bicarbonate transport system substrate-binding protein|nr:ABC transporter substrate-binding protein [Bifidobacteriaceae bacterium]
MKSPLKLTALAAVAALTASALAACGGDSDKPEASATQSDTATATAADTKTDVATETDTNTDTDTGTETEAETPTPAGPEAADYGSVTEQLSWFKNIEFSGEYAAIEDGFFAAAGFSAVELVAGGPTVAPAEVALAAGEAWIGRTSPLLTVAANEEGSGDFRIIAALYQRNPYALTYASDNPVTSAEDLIGQTVAVPDAAIVPWNIFLAANGIDPEQITRVPSTGGDAQEQIEAGAIATFTYGTGALLAANGVPGYEDFLLQDHGVPLVGEALVVSKETIDSERDKVKAFLTAWIQGWNAILGDTERAVSLAVDLYGKDAGLETASQTNSWNIQLTEIITDESLANGIGTISQDQLDKNVNSINLGGYSITADDLFDVSIINEIYAENPDLKYVQQ